MFVEACLKYGAVGVTEDTDILCWGDYAKEEADGTSGFLLVVLPGQGLYDIRDHPYSDWPKSENRGK